jgi:hypothetical protein
MSAEALALHRINQRKRGQAAAAERRWLEESLQRLEREQSKWRAHCEAEAVKAVFYGTEPVGPVAAPADRIDYWPVLPWAIGAGLACAFLVSRVWA